MYSSEDRPRPGLSVVLATDDFATIRDLVDALENTFRGGKEVVRTEPGDLKQLVVAIPAAKISFQQGKALVRAWKSARSLGVKVRYVVVP